MKTYKIRHNKSGLFSNGNIIPSFNDYGKTWSSLATLEAHLKALKSKSDFYSLYDGCEIVVYFEHKSFDL